MALDMLMIGIPRIHYLEMIAYLPTSLYLTVNYNNETRLTIYIYLEAVGSFEISGWKHR